MAFAFFKFFDCCSGFSQIFIGERFGKKGVVLKDSLYKMFHEARTISGGSLCTNNRSFFFY